MKRLWIMSVMALACGPRSVPGTTSLDASPDIGPMCDGPCEPAPELDTDGDGLTDAEEARLGTDPALEDTDADGVGDAVEVFVGTDPVAADRACGQFVHLADLSQKAVDVIFTVDNSGSMQREIQAVEDHINEDFADVLASSGLDYQVLVISRHGDVRRDEDICVRAPLSGTDCNPVPNAPVNTERFKHYDHFVGSTNSLQLLLGRYTRPDARGFAPRGWSGWLRLDAAKVFVHVTDDRSQRLDAAEFDASLLSKTPAHFGEPGRRRYVFHSIVGVRERPGPEFSYRAREPMVTSKCSTSLSTGTEYQHLSILTGGLRFPVCETDRYGEVLEQIARETLAQAKIPCRFKPPASLSGASLDLGRAMLEWREGEGAMPIARVEGASSCGPTGFYVDRRENVVLCPKACELVTGSEMGTLTFVSACDPEPAPVCVPEPFERCDDERDNDCDGFIDDEDPACLE